jgi:hypothetical protein
MRRPAVRNDWRSARVWTAWRVRTSAVEFPVADPGLKAAGVDPAEPVAVA